MGFRPSPEELAELIEEIDEDGSGAIEFPEFAQEPFFPSRFMQ
jgi:Ca2+-binding EF-hand superfamily protein